MLEIDLKTNIIVEETEAYENNFVRIYCGIINEINEDNGDLQKEIGKVEFWKIDGGRALNEGLDIVDICDSIDQETYDYTNSIYTDGHIEEKFSDDYYKSEILVLQLLVLKSKYRGRKIGLDILKKIIEIHADENTVVLLQPVPLQFSPMINKSNEFKDYDLNNFPLDKKEAFIKLIKYWKKLGIEKTNDPDIYYVVG